MRRTLELFMLESRTRLDAVSRVHVWRIAAVATVCLNAWLTGHFHDRFWWAPDEGNYAHVAERILEGEVLHADVQDVHPGYVNFANAGALGFFGRELSSMRYPLALLGIVQSLLIFLLLRPVGLLAAGVGASAVTALGFLQFLNPTAHWYSLFLTILLAGLLHRGPMVRFRIEAVGAIVMTVFLFRQLTGVLVAMGVLTFLLLEATAEFRNTDLRAEAARRRATSGGWLARGLIVVMIGGLTGYLAHATDLVGWVLFGIWPVLLLLHAVRAVQVPDARVLSLVARLAVGGLVAALPLLLYHALHGSLGAWYRDVFVTAFRLPAMSFFASVSYADQLAAGLANLASGDLRATINGAFSAVIPLVAMVVGLTLMRCLAKPGAKGAQPPPPALVVLAVFYGVVSVHYQIPIYLAYSVGLSFAGLLLLARGSVALTAAGAAAVAVAVFYHAGQPLSRGISGAAAGQRVEVVPSEMIPRLGLRIEQPDVQLYAALLELIERDVAPDESILAVPSHAELYFLSGRRNPFRFFNTALGVTTGRELSEVLQTLERAPPRLVFHAPGDKYNTPQSRVIMDHVAATYEVLPPIGQFLIYRRPSGRHAVAPGPAGQSLGQ